MTWYGGSGYPTVQVDGKYQSIGAGDCTSAYTTYRNYYNSRMTETGGLSPVSINDGFCAIGLTGGSMQARFRLEDATSLGTVQATFMLYEDGITWCCGYGSVSNWDHILRAIISVPVTTLVHQGDEVVVTQGIQLDPSWVVSNLHAVAVLQSTTGNKQVYQAGRLDVVRDFQTTLPRIVASVPQGSGSSTFTGTVSNISTGTDQITLSASGPAGWTTDFQLEGDPNWYTTTTISLGAGTSKGFTLRGTTDATKAIGTVTLSVHSAATGRTEPTSARIFNDSYAILMVDDDLGIAIGGLPSEQVFLNALDNLGYLYDHWDVTNGHNNVSPVFADMNGFDAIIWETAYIAGLPVTADDMTNLALYLDQGGKLFLSSMDMLSQITAPSPFVTNYLGVASWINNTGCQTASGVSGDPITGGMSLALTFSPPTINRVDTLVPTAIATGIFRSETGNINAVRTQLASGARAVFSTILQNAISTTASDPNNSQTVISRTLSWLLPSTSSVPVRSASLASGFVGVRPNPFNPRTEVSFNLSPHAASGPVRLTLVDASGRLVRTLVDGPITAGPHTAAWDGKDESSRPAPSGIYFARLQSGEGTTSTKMVLTR